MVIREPVAIFWDFDKLSPPSSSSGYEAADAIGYVAHEYGAVTSFRAYSDVPETIPIESDLRFELQIAGVSMCDCPQDGSKSSMILTDMFTYAMDHPQPATIIIISDNHQLAYAVSILRLRRYRLVVIAPSTAHPNLKLRASEFVDWDGLMEEERSQAESEPESGYIVDDNSVMAIPDSPADVSPVMSGSNLEQDDQEDLGHASCASGVIVNTDSLSGSDMDDTAQTAGLVVRESLIEHSAVSPVMARTPSSTSLAEATLAEANSGVGERGNTLQLDTGEEGAPTSAAPIEETPSLGEPEVPAVFPGTLQPLTTGHVSEFDYTKELPSVEPTNELATPLPKDFLLESITSSEFSLTSRSNSDAEDDVTTEDTSSSPTEESAPSTQPLEESTVTTTSPLTPHGPILSPARPSLSPEALILNPLDLASPQSSVTTDTYSPTIRDVFIHTPHTPHPRSPAASISSVSSTSVRVVGRFPRDRPAKPDSTIADQGASSWRNRLTGSARRDSASVTSAESHGDVPIAVEDPPKPREGLWSRYRDTLISMVTFKRQASVSQDNATITPPAELPSSEPAGTADTRQVLAKPEIEATNSASAEVEDQPEAPPIIAREDVPIISLGLPTDQVSVSGRTDDVLGSEDTSTGPPPQSAVLGSPAATVDGDEPSSQYIDHPTSPSALDSQDIAIRTPDTHPHEAENPISDIFEAPSPRDPSPERGRSLSPPPRLSQRALGKQKAVDNPALVDYFGEAWNSPDDDEGLGTSPSVTNSAHWDGPPQLLAAEMVTQPNPHTLSTEKTIPDTNDHSGVSLTEAMSSPDIATTPDLPAAPLSIVDTSVPPSHVHDMSPPPTLVPLAADPALFQSLVEEIRHHQSTRPDRSLVATGLMARDSNAYARVGVASFKEYSGRAVEAGVVILGETKHANGNNLPWISLTPAWMGQRNVPGSPVPSVLSSQLPSMPVEQDASTVAPSSPNPSPVPMTPSVLLRPVPPLFQSLVDELRQHKSSRVDRSMIATGLMKRDPGVYTRAGVTGNKKFKHYATLAADADIVTLGEGKDLYGTSTQWIELKASWRLPSPTSTSTAVRATSPAPVPVNSPSAAVSSTSAPSPPPPAKSTATVTATPTPPPIIAPISSATAAPKASTNVSTSSDAKPAAKASQHAHTKFAFLVARLEKMRSNGVSLPWRTLVNMDLVAQNPRVYEEAAVADFAEYAKQAVSAGIVTLGGEGSRAWISLV